MLKIRIFGTSNFTNSNLLNLDYEINLLFFWVHPLHDVALLVDITIINSLE